jgi:PAS domain S-box-containing protein
VNDNPFNRSDLPEKEANTRPVAGISLSTTPYSPAEQNSSLERSLGLRIFRLTLAAVAVGFLGFTVFWLPPPFAWTGLALVVFVAVLSLFPFKILGNEINLVHVLSLTGGFLAGPAVAGLSTLIGLVLGSGIRRYWLDKTPRRIAHAQLFHPDLSLSLGLQLIPLLASLFLFGWQLNSPGFSFDLPRTGSLVSALAALLTFPVLHAAIYLADYAIRARVHAAQAAKEWKRPEPGASLRRGLLFLCFLELGPLPFVFSTALVAAQTGAWQVVPLGTIAAILAVLIYEFSLSRAELERRLQELSSLNQVSRALRSTLSLENLLVVIQAQVAGVMGVDNFYVALYDPEEQRIWYPLAVKRGQRNQWQPRALMPDRLTDRVIREGQPVSLAPRREQDLDRIGLPASEETPQSWMGVPLITANHTIGCLAVFAVPRGGEASPTHVFTPADLNLLITLSGQVSVAIENALLYEQAQRRAEQLENLNHISALVTASLNPEEVFSKVCQSVAQMGGNRSAIFLQDTERGEVFLAHAFGLSDSFSRLNHSFPVTNFGRMRCLRTGRPVLSANLTSTPLELEYLDSLKKEGIRAYGEFPLTTPDGGLYNLTGVQHIGFLAVYYDSPHNFRGEELELIGTFASQAAIAVSNARLYAHVDTALSRRVHQLSILESIGRELSAAIHSERLFEIILDHAMKFTNSRWGELSLYNPKSRMLEVKAARGFALNRIHFTLQEGLAGQAVRSRQIVNIGNVLDETAYYDLTNGEARSQLCIPLTHEEGVLGVLSLESERPNAYTVNDQDFISQLATQAAIAVVNAQLYGQTQRRLRELSVLYLVSTHLVTNPDIQSVMQTIARSMEAALQTSSVGIYLWDEREAVYNSRYSIQSPSRPDCSLPEKLLYADLETFHPQLVKTGPLLIPQKRGQELLGECQDCQALVFPLIASRSESGRKQRLGMVLMHVPRVQVIQDDDLQLMRAVAAQVSISLQNALLFADVSHGRDQMAAVLNSVGEGILMIETDGNIMLANEFIQTITGQAHDSLLNRWLPNLPENALRGLGYTRAEAQALILDLGQGRAPESPKMTHKIGDRMLERSTSPVWGQGERLIGWLIVLRDVTEEHQVAQARELITGTLVHDLRSPVGSVISALAIIDEVLPKEQQDDIIDQAMRVAQHGAARVLSMIDTLLDISRMQAGRIDLVMNQFDLHTQVANTLVEFVTQANEYGIILRSEVPENLPSLCADQNKITRVLTNLVDNALKFTPAGGQVSVSAELHELPGKPAEIAVSVSDTGPGIPEEYQDRIFERFTQVPGAVGRRRGSGLGLTFCRMAIEAHGGRIQVHNRRPPETGSIFTFTLPLDKKVASS